MTAFILVLAWMATWRALEAAGMMPSIEFRDEALIFFMSLFWAVGDLTMRIYAAVNSERPR